jgi:uncharacterized damage-inducible protein DinB
MIPELAPSAQAFALGDRFLAGLVGDFSDADWQVADAVGHNPRWIVGHLAVMRNRMTAMAGHWDAVTAEQLAKPLGRTLPDGSDTIAGALRFLAWHEAYHLGQLGLFRRLAGKPGRA